MKRFDNLTNNKKESAIKVGSSVPLDAANIAFYSNESLSPKNNLSVIDVSKAIKENKSSMTTGIKTFYANELGILEDENGNTMFPTPNLSVSDSFIDRPYYTELLDQSQINPVQFFHHYYVSRYFTAAPGGISFSDLGDYLNENQIKFLNIKVLNEQNEDYIEASTGKKKYKILLESFRTPQNQEESDIPYRIIVGLDSTKPVNLKLIYDKVECGIDGIITKQDLRYSETINASQYFTLRPEESYVTDNSYNKKVYSVKKYNKKYADIFPGSINTTGYNVFVPKKALADNRTYEVFNWRLVARSRQSVNLELVDYFADIEQETGIKFRTIKAAVLYDSTDTTSYDNIEPYVFYRLQNSPFNFSKFLFENPNAQVQEKNRAAYWIVDINSIETLEDYDVVAFCPTKALSEKAKIIISNYVKIQNGTIIVDGSNYPSGEPFVFSDIYINAVSSQVVPTYYEYNETNKILDENKNGGWNINQSIFENQDYGIFGLKKNVYRNLNLQVSSSKSFLNIGVSAGSAGSVGALFEFSSQGDALSQGNIIFTSFSFLEYCNSLYSIGGKSTVANPNTGEYAVEESDQEVVSSVTEGPFKFFYNCVSFAMYSRAYAGRSLDTRSSIFSFVGEWSSSWAMNSEALLDSEKEAYFTNIAIQNSNSVYARDLIRNYSSIKDYYLQSIYNHLPSYQRDKISFMDLSQVEFFLEITNPDITVHNSTKITDPSLALSNYNIPTSYNLFKLNSGSEKAYAYTQTISPKINIPDGFGPYVVIEIPSIKSSSTRSISNQVDPVNYFQSYPFKFSTAYSYQTATDKPLGFSGDYTTNIKILYQGKGEFGQEKKSGTVVRNWTIREEVKTTTTTNVPTTTPARTEINPGSIESYPCVNIKSITDLFSPQGTIPASNSYQWRAFDYTYDIDSGHGPDTYAIGATGPYVRYVQSAMKAGNFYQASVDGWFGPVTLAAVSSFQSAMKTHKKVYNTSGRVDSETKSLIAYAMKNNLFGMGSVLNRSSPNWTEIAQAAVTQIGTPSQSSASLINQTGKYKKISYTGVGEDTSVDLGSAVNTVEDYIFFSIPDGGETVKTVNINFGSDPAWRKILLVSYGYSIFNHSTLLGDIGQVERSYLPKFNVNLRPNSNGDIQFQINNKISNGAKHFYIHIRTEGQIGGSFGKAEGYAINSITCQIQGMPTSTVIPGTTTLTPSTTTNTTFVTKTESLTYNAFPSLQKPEIEDVAQWYLEGTSGVYYDGQNLKSNQNGFKLFTINDEKYWTWNGSSWSQDNIPQTDTIQRNIVSSPKTFTYTVDAVVAATDSGSFSSINPNSIFSVLYDTNSVKSKILTFQNISYNYLGKEYVDTLGAGFSLSTSQYKATSGVVFDFTKPLYVGIPSNTSVTLSNVVTENGVQFASPLSAISIFYSRNSQSGCQQLLDVFIIHFCNLLFWFQSSHNRRKDRRRLLIDGYFQKNNTKERISNLT